MRISTGTTRAHHVRRTALAAAVLAAALSTTACGITEVSKDPSVTSTTSASTAPTASAAPSTTGPAAGGTAPSAPSASGTTGTPTSAPSAAAYATVTTAAARKPAGQGAAVATCTGAHTRVVVNRPARPINHLLLTATNKGSASCDLHGAPYLRFDQDQAATAVDDSTRLQSVIRLAPGRSAYASVVLVGERTGDEVNGRTASRLGVHFAAADGAGSVGPSVRLKLPSGTYLTDDARVMHWTESLEDALAY
ncbi:DUF4232 domain-containing protein [Streptomyces roseolilacinus]|uniref:DUF4232 domain-containing protein n=1 Tax=Streptomyces roseolilacinus TaxID=66904 RepID=A0A918AX21_9ACTN|nr:DUF4232 domain-containing protein [Streptomyces roseolilacinus]GGP96593.1 hypothetical protein GCM10010249_13520 [Streptomyces roseolilacinus]